MSIVVECEKRQETGKNAARRLREKDLIPAVMYGEGSEAVPLTVAKKDIIRIMRLESRENTLFEVSFNNEKHNAMIKELQIDPVSDKILHADLIRISMDKLIKVTVPVVVTGVAFGVKNEGGFVEIMTRELDIECLPKDIPESVTMDITQLHIHQTLKAENLVLPEGVKLNMDPGTVMVLVSSPTKAEEFVGEKPEGELEAGAAEPEVIKKGKGEEEETKEK